MAGVVLSIHVDAGARVDAGQHVISLESMKMEIPITVDDAGTVSTLHVAIGDVVDQDAILLKLSP
jgi:acetyl-CoA carboxylase biotin carboxyl carrier protein